MHSLSNLNKLLMFNNSKYLLFIDKCIIFEGLRKLYIFIISGSISNKTNRGEEIIWNFKMPNVNNETHNFSETISFRLKQNVIIALRNEMLSTYMRNFEISCWVLHICSRSKQFFRHNSTFSASFRNSKDLKELATKKCNFI